MFSTDYLYQTTTHVDRLYYAYLRHQHVLYVYRQHVIGFLVRLSQRGADTVLQVQNGLLEDCSGGLLGQLTQEGVVVPLERTSVTGVRRALTESFLVSQQVCVLRDPAVATIGRYAGEHRGKSSLAVVFRRFQ